MSAASDILVPVDGSERSRHAVRAAATLARALDAGVTLLHVHDPAMMETVGAAAADESTRAELIAAVEDQLNDPERDQALTDARALLEGVTVKARIMWGHPGEVICELAADTNSPLIVMATHGRSAIRELLIGSTAQFVSQHAPCPVTLVR